MTRWILSFRRFHFLEHFIDTRLRDSYFSACFRLMTLHCECFTRTRLSISKDRRVVPIYDALNKLLDSKRVVNAFLRAILVEDLIE